MTQAPSSSTSNNCAQDSPSRFPRTIVAVSREEFTLPIELTVRDASGHKTTLPNDLHGHFFMVGPAGSINSFKVEGNDHVVLGSKDGWTALYNGDGIVYRLSFDQGAASLKTRLMKPPCYYADLATQNKKDQYEELEFKNLGISRASLNKLGVRNQLNTAFLPFKLEDDESERLLITWDVGRPYEIDPETLEILTPVGKNDDWEDLLPNQPPLPFKNIMTSAHPVFDPNAGKVYTLNVGKSLGTMFGFSRSLKERISDNAEAIKTTIQSSTMPQDLQENVDLFYKSFLNMMLMLTDFLAIVVKILRFWRKQYNYVHLLEWDGKKIDINGKWNILLSKYNPLVINQTVHQMGLTEKYILFAETSFKFSLENVLPFQKNNLATSFKTFFIDFSDYPQYPSTKLYIVKRADLEATRNKSNKALDWLIRNPFVGIPTVIAQEVEIAPEFSHYLVDYDNTDNQIVLHISHLAASDISEYIRIFDRSAYDDGHQDQIQDKYDNPQLTSRLRKLAGSVVSPMDISRLGRWVIDGETGQVIDRQLTITEKDRPIIKQQLLDNQLDPKYSLTWSTAFYVYHDQKPTKSYTDIFWNSWGCWPDTLTSRTVDSYREYPQRIVDFENVMDLTYQGIPSSLCHLMMRRNSENEIKIELNKDNYYQFNNRYLGTSPQFVPRPDAEDQTDGYIVCTVLTSDELLSQGNLGHSDPEWSQNSEIWIFDARKLNDGPLYKLSHPDLNIGFSFHAIWMAEAKSPSRSLDYNVRQDYEDLIEQLTTYQPRLRDQVRKLFEEEIYPHFE